MGDGWMGLLCSSICISWTLFICVIFSIPTNLPVTTLNMNYASVSFSSTFYQKISLILFFCHFFLQGNHPRSYCICLVSFASIFFTVYFDVRICGCSVWYFAAAHKHYTGPKSNLNDDSVIPIDQDIQTKGWKCCGMTQKINIIQGASGTRIEHRVGGRSAAGFFFVYILGYGSIFFRSKSAVEVISAWKIYKNIEFLSQLLHPRNHWGERCHEKSEHYWPWQLLIGRRVKFLNPAEYSSSTQTAPKRSRRNSSESPPAA